MAKKIVKTAKSTKEVGTVAAKPRSARTRTATATTKTTAAKKSVKTTNVKAPAPKNTRAVDIAEVREWAIANKIPVGERGRIAADIVAQFQAAKKEKAKAERAKARAKK